MNESNPAEQKHTPGPWVIEITDLSIRTKDFESNAGSGDYRGIIIAEIDSPNWRLRRPDSIPVKLANARLIVAAPEMLELLKIWARSKDPVFIAWIEKCKALIARIEGTNGL
ncbi:MAG: hypothetical protein PHW53_04610 [Patescibacteria group bacterium]|nr:hypothetical protein [Patescibacteria group bacterium]